MGLRLKFMKVKMREGLKTPQRRANLCIQYYLLGEKIGKY